MPPHPMSRHTPLIVITMTILTAMLPACSVTRKQNKAPRQRSALELRSIQTRSFTETAPREALRAVVATLQDEGYIVQNVVTDVGLVVAVHDSPIYRERDDVADVVEGVGSLFSLAALFIPDKSRSSERTPPPPPREPPPPQPVAVRTVLNVTVTQNGLGTDVRITGQQSRLLDDGSIGAVWPVTSPQWYQEIFMKIDKSLFLVHTGL